MVADSHPWASSAVVDFVHKPLYRPAGLLATEAWACNLKLSGVCLSDGQNHFQQLPPVFLLQPSWNESIFWQMIS